MDQWFPRTQLFPFWAVKVNSLQSVHVQLHYHFAVGYWLHFKQLQSFQDNHVYQWKSPNSLLEPPEHMYWLEQFVSFWIPLQYSLTGIKEAIDFIKCLMIHKLINLSAKRTIITTQELISSRKSCLKCLTKAVARLRPSYDVIQLVGISRSDLILHTFYCPLY